MSTTKELIKKLHEEKLSLVDQLRGLIAEVEAGGGEWHGEDEAKSAALNHEIGSRDKRIDYLLNLEQMNRETEEQRAEFTRIIQPDAEDAAGRDSDDARMLAFLRASVPDAEVWAPRSITFKLSPKMAEDVHGRMGAHSVEYRDLTKGTTTAGGFTVPTGFVRTLYEHLVEAAAVRQTNPTIFTTDSGENLPVPKTTSHGAAALVTEGNALAESDPAFGQVVLGAYKFGQLIQVSTELIQDTGIDLLGYMARVAGLALGTALGGYHVTGTGSSQPEGIANSPTVGKTGTTGQTTSVIGDDLIDLFHSIVTGYRRRAVWIMNDASLAAIRKIREGSGATAGNYLWQPGLQAGDPDTILGKPVVTDPNVAVMAANAYSIAFGDFSLYFAIRDVGSVRFERSDDYAFANDLVTFRSIIRSDSKQVVNGAGGAVKFYRNSAT